MVLCLFQPPLQAIHIFTRTYLALLIFGERSLSKEQNASSLFKTGSVVTWERAFRNLWFNSSANKLAPLLGTRLNIIPGKNDKDSKDKEFLWET